jgi:hypothetical protein
MYQVLPLALVCQIDAMVKVRERRFMWYRKRKNKHFSHLPGHFLLQNKV